MNVNQPTSTYGNVPSCAREECGSLVWSTAFVERNSTCAISSQRMCASPIGQTLHTALGLKSALEKHIDLADKKAILTMTLCDVRKARPISAFLLPMSIQFTGDPLHETGIGRTGHLNPTGATTVRKLPKNLTAACKVQ